MHVLQRSEGPVAAGPIADSKEATLNFASMSPSRKDVARMRAEFAIAGFEMKIGASNDYSVGRWGMWRYFQDWPALLVFAKLTGVRT